MVLQYLRVNLRSEFHQVSKFSLLQVGDKFIKTDDEMVRYSASVLLAVNNTDLPSSHTMQTNT